MSKLILLYLTIVISLLFMLIPDNDKELGFFFIHTGTVSLEYYVYAIFEFVILLILMGIIANEALEYKFELWIFFALIFIDMVDWVLTYNSIWFNLGSFPVSMNTTKCIVFGLTIFIAWIRTLLK